MKEIFNVLNNTANSPKADKLEARKIFLQIREGIWTDIMNGKFPKEYVSANGRKYTGAPLRTAIRSDFLLANKIALGSKYKKDRISDLAQRDLLFSVLRYRETFPGRQGDKFYCCPKCTERIYACLSAKVFHYIDNDKWKAEIENTD